MTVFPSAARAGLRLTTALLFAAAACSGDRDAGGSNGRGAQDEITTEELAAYRLDMPRVREWYAANGQIAEVVTRSPQLAEAMDSEDDDESPTAAVQRLEAQPELAAAVRTAGLTPREYVLRSMALMQASFAAAVLEQNPEMELPPEVNRANVEFIQQNRGELERLQAEMRARYPEAEEAHDHDDEEDWEP